MKQRKTKSEPSIRVAVVDSDPLRFGGFRALLGCHNDLQLAALSSFGIGFAIDIDVLLLGKRPHQNLKLLPSGSNWEIEEELVVHPSSEIPFLFWTDYFLAFAISGQIQSLRSDFAMHSNGTLSSKAIDARRLPQAAV